MDRLKKQEASRKSVEAIDKDEQAVNDYRRDINAAHQQSQKDKNNRKKTREAQAADRAALDAKAKKKQARQEMFIMRQQQTYQENYENNLEKQYKDMMRNEKISQKNQRFRERTNREFMMAKAKRAEEEQEEQLALNEAREVNLARLRDEAKARGAIKQENINLDEKRDAAIKKRADDRHNRETRRAHEVLQKQKEQNEETGSVPMKIILAKNVFANLPLQQIMHHVAHEKKELDILKKIDFELLKGSEGQHADEQIFRTVTRLLAESQEYKLQVPDCSLAAYQQNY